MGFSPSEAKKMSVFEYLAVLEGFQQANSPDEAGKLSEDEKDDLWAWLQAT